MYEGRRLQFLRITLCFEVEFAKVIAIQKYPRKNRRTYARRVIVKSNKTLMNDPMLSQPVNGRSE